MANVGNVDRVVRAVLGLILVALPFLPQTAGWGAWGWVLAAVGFVLILTAALRFCPLYRVLGMNTCPMR